MERHSFGLSRFTIIVSIIIVATLQFPGTDGLRFVRSSSTFAKYPKWNACTNSSITFEFKTSLETALLMYTDDGGNSDYVQLILDAGKVRLEMKIADNPDGLIETSLGTRLNDNNWHRVEIRRNRMETTLYVDREQSSGIAFGADFNFGQLEENNDVYFGGLPDSFKRRRNTLSLSSVISVPRFEGEIRNVIYGNCSCQSVRGEVMARKAAYLEPKEACLTNDDCGNCLCISKDDGSGCQCADRHCTDETDVHYQLPMDRIEGSWLVNPSGLDSRVSGQPRLVPGVVGHALKIDGRRQWLNVSGPAQRNECFGDLSLCPRGYTIGFWMKMDTKGFENGIYLSNGGHSLGSHGIAMAYKTGELSWIFRLKDGREWRVTAYNILPHRWYYVTAAWSMTNGLTVYINGDVGGQEVSPTVRTSETAELSSVGFIIGRANDGSDSAAIGTITVDELQFWSRQLDEITLREKGPIYKYHLDMDQMHKGQQLIVQNLEPRVRGTLISVPGKIGRAVMLKGRGEFIDLGPFTDTCLGDTRLCMYGFTATFWVKFNYLGNNSYIMASGRPGFSVYSNSDVLYATVQRGRRQWLTSVSGLKTGTWYFIELTWQLGPGLRLYLDQKLAVEELRSSHHTIAEGLFNNNMYIGRANTAMNREKYAAASIDDVQLFNGDRDTLLAIGFITRGKPDHSYYGFDAMSGSRVNHSTTIIDTRGQPRLVPGKVDHALHLNGRLQTAEFVTGDNCLGNLDYCQNGAMLALWFRADRFEEGMFFLSSAVNGITMYFVDGKLCVTAATSTLIWMIKSRAVTLEPLVWYYIEISWSEDQGLQLYVNNKLVEQSRTPRGNTEAETMGTNIWPDKFYLGKENGRKTGKVFGAATYDEMEFWFGSRDFLLAFNYIQRSKPTSYRIQFDKSTDNGRRLSHPSLSVTLHGSPRLVTGKMGKAALLNGRDQYVDLGSHAEECLGNLAMCTFGISIFFYCNFQKYDYNMYILSTGRNGVRMYHYHGYIFVTVERDRKSWRLSFPRPSEDVWHLVELSWHPERGLNLYVDNERLGHADAIQIPRLSYSSESKFLVGAPNDADVRGQRFGYANMIVDELEIWYGRREELLAFDYILRGKVGHESFTMETASRTGVLDHASFNATLEQGARLVPGKIGKGVALTGSGQFVNLGEHEDKCFANIDLCNHGITISLWLKPRSLSNNTYFLSGPTYKLYYINGQLRADFVSGGKIWKVKGKSLTMLDWDHVMLSWDHEDGLELYMNDVLVDADVTPEELPQGDQSQGGSVYLGKSADSRRTADTLVDEVQFWYAKLEKLKAQGFFGEAPSHEQITWAQAVTSDVVKFPSRTIYLKGGATVVKGQNSQYAIRLSGKRQYIDLGKDLLCGGDLDLCPQGFTMRLNMKPEMLKNNMYFLDSYPISIFFKNGKLYTTVKSSTKTWTVAAPTFESFKWQTVDVSWHPEAGLTVYINGEDNGAHKTHGTSHEPVYNWNTTTYIGRAHTNMEDERYADATVEDIEVWNIRRDELLSGAYLHATVKPTERPVEVPGSVDIITPADGAKVETTKRDQQLKALAMS